MSPVTICVCHHVTEDEIVGWIRRGVTTVEGLGEHCDAGQGCGDCRESLEELIEDFGDESGADGALAVSRAQ
ncbi:(2Fe-2S)-binding protein [Streptomyces abyssomicinicus]|uniref:(2Fe-2S)-binding protein n=1 Tax=Streptomyces abyssomicinicus TaxID=574929 RepID=UPI00124FD820|nr:(2Fe-2S)-binding protein [Streptomyces abyssomicinicus]